MFQTLRERAGLTQAGLAKLIPSKRSFGNINQTSISDWERGITQPELTIPQTKALCRALGVKLEELPDDFGPRWRSQPDLSPGDEEE
ncbi:MAG: helix-turn-helix transcriptional regulator [Oscillatoria sp. SIO1A7]|nr:helix-turn-helix transcriptional regulator [Oscillatoria sp. SIO1A7]